MATHDVYVVPLFTANLDDASFKLPGAIDAAGDAYWQAPAWMDTATPLREILGDTQVLAHTNNVETVESASHGVFVCETIGGLWWDRVHVIPKVIALGNLLSDQSVVVTVHNAFRGQSVDWLTFVNNTGSGTSVVGLPTFADTIGPQDGRAITYNVDADTGPAQVVSNMIFTFDVPSTVELPVSFTRLVVFPWQPQKPVREVLQSRTWIGEAIDGTEQRRKSRKNPRQLVEMVLRLTGRARQNAKAVLQDHQGRLFGLPIWWEARQLSAAAAITDTVINVDTTDYADFRVGSLCIIWSANDHFEAQEIDSFTSTTITVASPLTRDYTAGALVMPLRTAFVSPALTTQQHPVNAEDFPANFVVTDNDSNLGSAAAFSTYNSKILLDDANIIASGTLPNTLERRVQLIDSGTGRQTRFSPWDRSKPGLVKSFVTQSRQALWEYRQLLHELNGMQISFYIPTFYKDMTPTSPLSSGSTNFQIENIGYTKHVQHRAPYNVIRVVETDGTTHIREITGEVEISEDIEQLSVDSSWPSTIAIADIERIEYILLVRRATDSATLQHRTALGEADIQFPLKGLFE